MYKYKFGWAMILALALFPHSCYTYPQIPNIKSMTALLICGTLHSTIELLQSQNNFFPNHWYRICCSLDAHKRANTHAQPEFCRWHLSWLAAASFPLAVFRQLIGFVPEFTWGSVFFFGLRFNRCCPRFLFVRVCVCVCVSGILPYVYLEMMQV